VLRLFDTSQATPRHRFARVTVYEIGMPGASHPPGSINLQEQVSASMQFRLKG